MSTIVLAWVNATARKDKTSLSPSDIGGSIISQVNKDGSLTTVDTVTGNGTTATLAAPTAPGTYLYQVQNVDLHGVVGDAGVAVAPVVIAPVAPPVDSSPPEAPTNVTATLTPAAPAA